MSAEVTEIGKSAFKNTALTEIPVVVDESGKANVTSIGASAFEGVKTLSSITFWQVPTDAENHQQFLVIGNDAFKNTSNLKISMIDIPSWVKLGTGVFYSSTNYLSYLLFEGDQWDDTSTDVTALANAAKENMELCLVNLNSPNFSKVSIPMSATNLRTYFSIIAGEPGTKWATFTPEECFDWAVDNATGDWTALKLNTDDENWNTLKTYITGSAYGNGTLYIPEYHQGQPVRIIGGLGQFGANVYGGDDEFVVTKIVIPDSVTMIFDDAFTGFVGGTRSDETTVSEIEVEFGANTKIRSIGKRAFKGVPVKTITINGKTPLIIGEDAFLNTQLTTLTIKSLGSVGKKAFYGLTALKNVDITFVSYKDESGVEHGAEIGESAFARAAKTDNFKLETGEYNSSLTYFENVNGVYRIVDLTSSEYQASIYYVLKKNASYSYKISGSIASIAKNAFLNNNAAVWNFVDGKALNIGDSAFENAWVSVVPSNAVTIGDYAYKGATIEPVKEKGVSVAKVTVNDVTSIGKGAFTGSTITSFSFGTELADFFADNASGDGSLHSTPSLKEISYGDGNTLNPKYGVKSNVLYVKNGSKAIAIKYPERATGEVGDLGVLFEIGYGAFRGTRISKASFSSVKKIGDYAFADCTAIVSVNNDSKTYGLMFSNTFTEIGAHAFEGCSSLEKISLTGLSDFSIGNYAFNNTGADNTGLKEIYISARSLVIGSYSFAKDSHTYVTVPLVTFNTDNITINGKFYATTIFVPNTAPMSISNLYTYHKVSYTPTECLIVDAEGRFCGASGACELHPEHVHGNIVLPLYYTSTKLIIGVYADEGVLYDGDSTTELTSVAYSYGYKYLKWNGTAYEEVTVVIMATISSNDPVNITTLEAIDKTTLTGQDLAETLD